MATTSRRQRAFEQMHKAELDSLRAVETAVRDAAREARAGTASSMAIARAIRAAMVDAGLRVRVQIEPR